MSIELPEAFRDLFRPARYKAFYGGRGSGKSHAMATTLVLLAAQMPLRVLAARQFQRSIRDSSKRLIDDRIEALGLLRRFRSTETDIQGPNGSLILFAGLATQPGFDQIDGGNRHRLGRGSRDHLAALARHPGPDDPQARLGTVVLLEPAARPATRSTRCSAPGRRRPTAIVRRVSYADNPWFPAVLEVERQWDLARDPDKHAHIWEGEYQRHVEARIFRNWRVETLEPPAGARPFLGADWGFATDPTVLVRCFLFDRVLYIDAEAYRVGCPIDEMPALFRTIGAPQGPGAWPIVGRQRTARADRPSASPGLPDPGCPEGQELDRGRPRVPAGLATSWSTRAAVTPSTS